MTNPALLQELLEKLDDSPQEVREEVIDRLKPNAPFATHEAEAKHRATLAAIAKEYGAMQAGRRNFAKLRGMLATFTPLTPFAETFVASLQEAMEWRERLIKEGRSYPVMK